MDINWTIVTIGIFCWTLWFVWLYYHGKVETLRMEIKVLKGELCDERARGESFSRTADEWRGVAMRADAEVERLKHEKALIQKTLAHRMLEDGRSTGGWDPDYWRKVLDECEAELGGAEYRWKKMLGEFRADVNKGGKHVG